MAPRIRLPWTFGVRHSCSRAALAGLVFASSVAAQSSSAVVADSQALAVLRDFLTAATSWRGDDGRLCVDAWVARYARTPIRRWSTGTLRELLRDSLVAVDSSSGNVPTGSRACARSRGTMRLAFGVPRIRRDSGAVVFIASRLDARAQADSFLFDWRLRRTDGRWNVAGWLADSQTTHTYVRGNGCYAFSHSRLADPEAAVVRIDSAVVRAQDVAAGSSWNGFPAGRLLPGPAQIGLGGSDGNGHGYWWVTHDSLHLSWSAVFSYVTVDLLVLADSLRGSMTYHSDAIVPNPPRVDVRGRRVRCP